MATIRNCSLPYGEEEVRVSIPEQNFSEFLAPKQVKLPPSDEEEIRQALENPIGALPLENVVKPGEKVVLLCEDASRFAQTDKMLVQIVERLNRRGIPDRDIAIVMALGSHKPMSEEQISRKIGSEMFHRLEVYNSEFKDKKLMVDMGLAPGGVRVWLDSRVHGYTRKIGVGSIIPHPSIGYSGGGKIIYPGVVGEETVGQFHLRSASAGNLTGLAENDVRRAMEEWVGLVGLDYIVNAVVTPENRIYRVVAGHYVSAHRKGVEFAREIYGIQASEKVDIALVSSHTADMDFIQAGKGITNCETIVKDGGLLVLVSPCRNGVGPHSRYLKYVADPDPDGLLRRAWEGMVPVAELLPLSIATVVARIMKRIRIALVSGGLPRAEIERAGLLAFPDLQKALDYGLQLFGTKARISLVPFGGDSYTYLD